MHSPTQSTLSVARQGPSVQDVQYTQSADLSDVVLHVLIEASGNPRLAQDILKRKHDLDLSVPDMAQLVKDRLPELKASMEVVSTLELFSMMPILHKTMIENLSSLEPGEAVRAYMDLMALIGKSTQTNELTININDEIWRRTPRDLQRVYAALEASGQLSQIIEHDSSAA